MYQEFFGLSELPFELTANPRFLFLSAKHREALATLQYGLLGRKGVTLLLGDAGTGKTSLIAAALEAASQQPRRIVHVSNPTLTRAEFYELLAHAFGLSPAAAHSKTRFLLEIDAALVKTWADGHPAALIIDEAQSLPDVLLEELRLLANLETPVAKLLPVLLVGQPELSERLNERRLRHLKQRVALRCHLGPLSRFETAAYIAARLRTAGGTLESIFEPDALPVIYDRARGIPRAISVICDNALVAAFGLGRRPVGRAIVTEVCKDLDLPSGAVAVAAQAPPISPGGELFSHYTERRRFSFF